MGSIECGHTFISARARGVCAFTGASLPSTPSPVGYRPPFPPPQFVAVPGTLAGKYTSDSVKSPLVPFGFCAGERGPHLPGIQNPPGCFSEMLSPSGFGRISEPDGRIDAPLWVRYDIADRRIASHYEMRHPQLPIAIGKYNAES